MARTRQGEDLTESHRLAQAYLAASVVGSIRDLFMDNIDLEDIDGSTRGFIRKALPLILRNRDASRRMATTYLRRFRDVELRALMDHEHLRAEASVDLGEVARWDSAEDIELGDVDDYLDHPQDVAAELYAAGAHVAKQDVKKGRTPAKIRERAANSVAAQAMKQVSDGARAPIRREVERGNHGAGGYFRVVDADPCPFCAMLAARGPVYSAKSFQDSNGLFSGDGQFKVHAGCGCSMEPIFGRGGSPVPETNKRLADEWARIASGRNDPWNTWRRYKRSGTVPDEYDQDEVAPSAPQVGRNRRREDRETKGTRNTRKPLDQLDEAELIRALNGMELRRKGMRTELASLEARGVPRDQPGPAQSIVVRLARLDKQIAEANRLVGMMGTT